MTKISPNNKPYIIAVVFMAFISISGVVLLQTLRPEVDNTNIIIEIFGFSAAITTGLYASMKSQEAAIGSRDAVAKSQETHLAVNSRLDEYKEMVEALAMAQGIDIGIARANARTDILAQKEKVKDD